MNREKSPFSPDKSDAGMTSKESEKAVFTWFGPVGEPQVRYRYAVIKEEDGILSIQPGEGRFKKGLKAVRYESEDAESGSTWLVVKVRNNRIDLQPVTE